MSDITVIALTILICVFALVAISLFKHGVDGALKVWGGVGTVLGAITGFYFSKGEHEQKVAALNKQHQEEVVNLESNYKKRIDYLSATLDEAIAKLDNTESDYHPNKENIDNSPFKKKINSLLIPGLPSLPSGEDIIYIAGHGANQTNQTLEYYVTLGNPTSHALNSNGLDLRLPEGISFSSISDGGAFSYSEIHWNLGLYPPKIQKNLIDLYPSNSLNLYSWDKLYPCNLNILGASIPDYFENCYYTDQNKFPIQFQLHKKIKSLLQKESNN